MKYAKKNKHNDEYVILDTNDGSITDFIVYAWPNMHIITKIFLVCLGIVLFPFLLLIWIGMFFTEITEEEERSNHKKKR